MCPQTTSMRKNSLSSFCFVNHKGGACCYFILFPPWSSALGIECSAINLSFTHGSSHLDEVHIG